MSSAIETVRIIRVFVSSPGDVAKERAVMHELVDSINRTDGKIHGIRVELFNWENDVVPQIGPKPQQVVDSQTPAYDIYLGIMSTRFGTPTGRYGSGTEREFRDALKNWKGAGFPWITFYFDAQPKLTGDAEQAKQFVKVCEFKAKLEKQGIVATYAGVRDSADSFYEKASLHLRKIIQHFVALQTDQVSKPAPRQASTDKVKILFLASMPDDQSRLRLDIEFREVDAKIRASEYRDRVDLVSRWAVRAGDLQEVLLRERPDIVHFSGHGSAAEKLILEDDAGRALPVSKEALTELFRILKDNVRVVVLNACFSEPQAEAIAQVVGCAVGMKQAIGDTAAVQFAAAFYQAIGYGQSVQTAFELGCNSLQLLNIPEENTPALLRANTKPTVPPVYIEWLLSRCGDVELMGLELKHGSGVRLNHVYTPLATSAHQDNREKTDRPRPEELMAEEREAKQLLLGLLNEQSLYVSGDPGSGKSTFCRWVTWLTCNGTMPAVDVPAPEGYQETFPDHLYGRIPVLVRLRDFWQFLPPSGVQSIGLGGLETALRQWLADQEYPGLDWACLKSHLDGGSALLMLDGVDEVPPVRSSDSGPWYPRDMLIAGLAEAVARWTKDGNCVLVTSRPYGLDGEQQRKLGLMNAPILSLDDDLQTLLVRRWFIRLKEARDLGLETADAMMDHIRVERGLHELAINPLLLTAMCIIYDEGKRLPHDKYLLYDRIVDTVLHKRYMGKESIETIRGRLAAVALGMHTGEGLGQQREAPEATASEREIDLALQAYRKVDGSTDPGLTDTVRVREDLLSQSGLLVSRGDDGAAFYHLSIQEFLAAERLFILHGQKREDLVKLFLSRGQTAGWRNTLGLLFGDLVDTFKPHSGVECLRELSCRIALPPLEPVQRGQPDGLWNQAIVFGDCLQILQGRESAIPDDLTRFFQPCVFRAIEQEIAVKDRQTLGVTLGRLGDPRVEPDLRLTVHPDKHPGYVKIPADTYYVGDEKNPLVIEEPFWLSKYPVTNSQYALFVADGGYAKREFWSDDGWQWIQAEKFTSPGYWGNQSFNAPNQPVVTVSWWEAEAFCRWAGGSLPTEQQWEVAARGPEGFKYPWGDDGEDGICNSGEAGLGGTSAVGIFPRSTSAAFGLVDMAGNVDEWCAAAEAPDRVIRGGSWADEAQFCRSAGRCRHSPEDRYSALGFRLAAVPPSEPDKDK